MFELLKPLNYVCDGLTFRGFIADGSQGKRAPGILVGHEAPGLNDHIKSRAQRLAQLGYVAFAYDLYGEAFPLEEMMNRHTSLWSTPGLVLRRTLAALDALKSLDTVDSHRLAAIGFCQGGGTALELARANAPIRAAIGFHPGLQRPAGSSDGPISAKVLMMIGDQDPVVPHADRLAFATEMDAKGADWQLHVFGGVGHTYTNPDVDQMERPGFAYNAAADQRSWSMMLALLEETGCTASEA